MRDLKYIAAYLRPCRRDLTLAMVLVFLESLLEMIIPVIMTDIVDIGVPDHNIPLILRQGGKMVLCALLVLFLGTRLGLSIRATGDNADMVRASSINPNFTITVGLCVANAMTGLSGAMVAQYSTFADVNSGTGMVVLALAALVIGETLIGKGSMVRRVAGVVAGSLIYRFIYAAALRFNVPAEYMKLVSAVIVGVAIAAPEVRRWAAFQMQKCRAMAERRGA